MGIVGGRTSAADYDADMKLAKSAGIDAFALNIGTDDGTDTQLGYAYESAANNDMKVFISFDFTLFDPASSASTVGSMIATYGSQASQLLYDGKVVASSFNGDGLDVSALRSAAGDIVWLPNFHPQYGTDMTVVDGALNWMAWPNDGNNKAPQPGGTSLSVEDGDAIYRSALGPDRTYVAPVSPWFFTHYGAEVDYSKNFMFPSDTLWFDRWSHIVESQPQPPMVEVISWNDYGESHYVGRLDSPHGDDGNSKWAYGRPHSGFLDMARPFIAAYRAGSSDVSAHITDDSLVYWFRTTLKDVDCDSTDTTMADGNNSTGNYFHGRPNGWDTAQDKVYVVTLLTAPATLSMTSGDRTDTVDVPAGAAISSVDMAPGTVHLTLSRDGANIFDADAGAQVVDSCPCGIYNFNPYVGTLPAGDADELLPEGYSQIMNGLNVDSCGPY
ncbi:Glycosyl hydrolase family 71 [Geosmithia morbida]|uniref:Glycosyl hydrolase family 71 n=1 Tax=Geosmithia morbida TaxID=1094350 RepID=A0A9P4Z3T9_9HYPO|nr:Glycosyl hydrolase family 71 [Geosmithia morbida]KAF4126924.1 Glycosyl hydrolase family 71 [Geosmithia morbida]